MPLAGVSVTIDGKPNSLSPDRLGRYPRLHVPPGATVQVRAAAAPGSPVAVEILDGGCFAPGRPAPAANASAEGYVDFSYQVRQEPGSYRVAVFSGSTRQVFDFWVDEASVHGG